MYTEERNFMLVADDEDDEVKPIASKSLTAAYPLFARLCKRES